MKKITTKNNKGYTLLFTVLVTSIILAIAIGISRVSFTEVLLSSVVREGAVALFAADTGLECGLFNDLENQVFIPPQAQNFSCGIEDFVAWSEGIDPNTGQNAFMFEFTLPDKNACAKVKVFKSLPNNDPNYPNTTLTRVESLGYNQSCQMVNAGGDAKTVERALRASYINALQLGGGGNLQAQTQGQGQIQ
jgi:hypothetical protein